MFQFIRKHQAIGLIFIGIVIVSFVIFFSPNQQAGGRGMPRGALGTIGGRPVERDEYVQARQEARLAHMLREGNWPGRDWDEQQQIYNRLFLLDEANRLGITVADEVAAQRIVELPFLQEERTRSFNRAAYDQFLAAIRQQEGITPSGFEQFIRHEVALQHLVQIGGLSGTLIPPAEASARYKEENMHYGGDLVIFAASNHLAEVNLSPTNIAQYYSNRLAEYRIPERVVVRYVKFDATNYLAAADEQLASNTNLVQGLEAEYQRRGPEAFRDTQGNLLTPELAKAGMKDEFRHTLALDAARKKAVEFANRLYRLDSKPDSLNQLAATESLAINVSLPFDQFRPPLDMSVPTTFNRAAFSLSEAEPFATPVVGEDAVYVFAFDHRIPSEIQPLETVQARVTESLRRNESRALAEAAGRKFALAAREGMAAGKSFESLATEAGVSFIHLTNFSRATTSLPGVGPQITVSELLRIAADLHPPAISDFTPTGDGGMVLHLTAKNEPPDAEIQEGLVSYLKHARQMGRFTAFMEWQRKRYADADVRLPNMGGTTTNSASAVR